MERAPISRRQLQQARTARVSWGSRAVPDPDYLAFVSYSHVDEVWAKWLHQALERYVVPKPLVGRTTAKGVVPRRLTPIFRDRDELPGSPSLEEEIRRALQRSRSLIVICSPHSAVSRYVNGEIIAFKRLGREADIYCLLIGGEPHASDRPESGLLEAFPAAIRFRVDADGTLTDEPAEPLAADVRTGKDARADAKLKIVAGLLGVGFDELKHREARRRFHHRLQIGALTLAVVMAIGGVWWNRQRELEGQRQIALAQRLIDQSTELLDSEEADIIQRGTLLILQALLRLEREAPDLSTDGEAAQARLAADQNLRRTLSLFYTAAAPLSAASPANTYADRGWASWTAEAVAFSGNGKTLTAASGWGYYPAAAAARWQVATGAEDRRLRIEVPGQRFDWPTLTDRSNPRYFALSPDGDYLATIADRGQFGEPSTATVYHLADDRVIERIEYNGRITGVALGLNGAYLAIAATTLRGQSLPLQVWHVTSGRALDGFTDPVQVPGSKALAFSRDGRYLAVASARISLWELPMSDAESRIRPGPRLDLYRGESVAFSPDSLYVAAAGTEATAFFGGGQPAEFGRRFVRVWKIGPSRTLLTIEAPQMIRALALGADARHLAVVDNEHSAMLHAVASGRATRVHFAPSDPPNSVGRRSRDMKLSGKGPGARGTVTAVTFSPTDDLMAMAGETDAVVLRVSSFNEQLRATLDGDIEDIAFDRDERSAIVVLKTAAARTLAVRAFDVESGREQQERRAEHVADAFALTLTGDLVLARDDAPGSGRGGSIVVLAGETVGPFRYDGDVQRVFVTRDSRYLAVATSLGASTPKPVAPGRHQATIWQLSSGSQVLRFDYTTAERDNGIAEAFFTLADRWYLGVRDARRLPDGALQSTFELWDMESREQPERTPEIMRLLREDLATSADGRWYALESGNEVSVITVAGQREIARIPLPTAGTDSIGLSSDPVAIGAQGRYVATITEGRTMRILPVDSTRLRAIACARLTRDLSLEEWAAYLPTERPQPTCPR
jgi:WD40 repeat protein